MNSDRKSGQRRHRCLKNYLKVSVSLWVHYIQRSDGGVRRAFRGCIIGDMDGAIGIPFDGRHEAHLKKA